MYIFLLSGPEKVCWKEKNTDFICVSSPCEVFCGHKKIKSNFISQTTMFMYYGDKIHNIALFLQIFPKISNSINKQRISSKIIFPILVNYLVILKVSSIHNILINLICNKVTYVNT